MLSPRRLRTVLIALACLVGCANSTEQGDLAEPILRVDAGQPTARSDAGGDRGLEDDAVVFTTDEYTLGPGEERFLCFATTMDQDVVVGSFSYEARPTVHHLMFSRALVPEPEGFSDCDVLFRMTWSPLFGAATSDATLQFPEGHAAIIRAGEQLVAQLHLLNTDDAPATGALELRMHPTDTVDPEPVGLYGFGGLTLAIPARTERATLSHTCMPAENLTIFSVIPHMHYRGRALRFEVGDSVETLEEVFRRDPYDFDDQRFEEFTLDVAAGAVTRVSCDFENETDEVIGFGESSHDEMCFLLAYALGRNGISGCTTPLQ